VLLLPGKTPFAVKINNNDNLAHSTDYSEINDDSKPFYALS
jgi:hypothetical protein